MCCGSESTPAHHTQPNSRGSITLAPPPPHRNPRHTQPLTKPCVISWTSVASCRASCPLTPTLLVVFQNAGQMLRAATLGLHARTYHAQGKGTLVSTSGKL